MRRPVFKAGATLVCVRAYGAPLTRGASYVITGRSPDRTGIQVTNDEGRPKVYSSTRFRAQTKKEREGDLS